jgi:hypothetical protein
MAKLLITGIPEDTGLSVFGMSDGQWTVNGDPAETYYTGTPGHSEISVELEPRCVRVLVRAANIDLNWRPDRRSLNPETDSYEDQWVAEIDGDLTLDLADHLEPDPVMRADDVRPASVTIEDMSTYEPFQASLTSLAEGPSAAPTERSLPNERKSIYAIVPTSVRKKVEHFRHSMPREIMWLFRSGIPLTKDHHEVTFLYYEFGKGAEDLDSDVLEAEPWRLDAKNQAVLEDFRQKFLKKVGEWGGKARFLTHREIRNISPWQIREDYPLTLPQVMSVSGDDPLWRYTDFAKFVSLIETQALWFSRPSKFDDPFESKTNKSSRLKHLVRWMDRLITDFNSAVYEGDLAYVEANSWWARDLLGSESTIQPIAFGTIQDVPPRFRMFCERSLDASLDAVLINCWHQNKSESDVMWRAYTDSSIGVAVITSFDSLTECFRVEGKPPRVLNVEYHDLHDEGVVFDHLPSAYKHIAFEAEREVRAYMPTGDLPDGAPGTLVPVDLSKLIEGVTTSPSAPQWFIDSVQWVLEKAGMGIEVQPSVFSRPLY